MKRFFTLLVVLCLAAGSLLAADFSVGVILGEPTGLSAKLWLSPSSAVDAALAWSFLGSGAIYIHVDYLQHVRFTDVRPGVLRGYVGIGPKLSVGDDLHLGIRIPVGSEYQFQGVPLELFLELAPGLMLFPATKLDVGAGFGLRYRF